MTPCTTPAAPFYELDVLILGAIESLGIDAPCPVLAGGTALVIGAALLVLTIAAFAIAARFNRRK